MLEADLWRSEAKMEALRRRDCDSAAADTNNYGNKSGNGLESDSASREHDGVSTFHPVIAEDNIYDYDDGDEPQGKEDGERMWRDKMESRFVAGRDDDFEDYEDVDKGKWDDGADEEREEEEKWFDEEEERWFRTEESDGDGYSGGEAKVLKLKGETGLQDF